MVYVPDAGCGRRFQAKLILALSDGVSYSRIEAELKTSRPTISALESAL
jgi:transcriptional regulator